MSCRELPVGSGVRRWVAQAASLGCKFAELQLNSKNAFLRVPVCALAWFQCFALISGVQAMGVRWLPLGSGVLR